jgi:hypothetical protein
MPISLKHINTSDSDTIKLDKVNYNFDQLVANGGGPRGPQGPIGETGIQGTTGVQGFQGVEGNQGTQGTQGPILPNYWKNLNILPQDPPLITIEAKTLIPISYIGDNFAPVIKIGYVEADSEYGTKSDLVGGKTPYQWNINRRPYSTSNLRFLSSVDLDTAYDFKLNREGGTKDSMTMGFLDLNYSTTEYVSGGISFRSSVGSSDSLYINRNETLFKKPTTFDSPVISEDAFFIQNSNEGTGKIAISDDINGLVKFKDVKDLGGTVAVGTIISVPTSIFNSSFVNNETVNIGNDEPLRLSCGSGNGIYDGWYLCNGKTWDNGSSFSYKVPQLGMFTYRIYDNINSGTPNSQGLADQQALPNSILAGVPDASYKNVNHIHAGNGYSMYAEPNPGNSLIYSYSESTVSETQWPFTVGTGTTFKVKQLPQIIYLGKSGLKWTDQGTGQNPFVLLTFKLNDSNPFTNSPTTSKLSPNPYTLTSTLGTSDITISTKLGNAASYSFESKVTAPAGYYWEKDALPLPSSITGLPGYATITSIFKDPAGSATFPTSIIIEFSISSHPVFAPNQTLITETLSINTTNMIRSIVTPITISTTNPTNVTLIGAFNTYIPSYNLVNGYTFTAQYKANTGYTFIQANGALPSVSIAESFDGILEINGTISVSGAGSSNEILYIPMRLRDVPQATSNVLQYAVNINSGVWAKMPIITLCTADVNKTNYTLYNTIVNTGAYTRIGQVVTNNTSKTIYIFVGIDQRNSPQWKDCNAWGCTTYYYNWAVDGKWRNNDSATNYIQAYAGDWTSNAAGILNYYWSGYYSIASGQALYGVLQQETSSDPNHTIELFWSFSPTDIASRTRFTYNLY